MRLEVRDLSFAYHRGKTVLDGISFAYSAPDVLCILGENGMGRARSSDVSSESFAAAAEKSLLMGSP